MNERIRQLAEQSQLWDKLDPRSLGIPGGSTESRWGEELQEFAELIVAEMLQTCEDHPAWTGRMIGEQIRKHFGVEE